ncbi:hypothetical protein [Benzoatithermus flavus]|uniref:Uncharacterized protein n=1 Tax=Benzoatithermus flavus TaxID=3108223 RepID=A0ABU8XP46_9PROT
MSGLRRRPKTIERQRDAGRRLMWFVMRAPGEPMSELPDAAPLFMLVTPERDREAEPALNTSRA